MAALTPSDWEFGAQVNPLTLAGSWTKTGSAMTTKTEQTGTTNPTMRAMFRWVYGPLDAQTIDGTVKGQMRGAESNSGANATLCVAIKIVTNAGADRAILLAPTASDSGAGGHEFITNTLTNALFETQNEVSPITLTSGVAVSGDYLVVEVGFRSATGTDRTVSLSYGDDNASDLPEDTSTTTALNPWIEFSATIADRPAAVAKGGIFHRYGGKGILKRRTGRHYV